MLIVLWPTISMAADLGTWALSRFPHGRPSEVVRDSMCDGFDELTLFNRDARSKAGTNAYCNPWPSKVLYARFIR